jgi:integrase
VWGLKSSPAGAEIKEFERLDDAKNATWTIPAARSKNGKAHVVPLSGPALSIVVDLVKRASALAGEHSPPRFVFVSPNDPKKPIDGHAFSVAMIRFGNASSVAADAKDYGFDEVRAITTWTSDRPSAHDLRRTLATRLAGSGIPAEDVSACLNHTRRSIRDTTIFTIGHAKNGALLTCGLSRLPESSEKAIDQGRGVRLTSLTLLAQ